ncbi:MAG: transglutaminase-like domain-containing protein [Ferruginibacter sp.]
MIKLFFSIGSLVFISSVFSQPGLYDVASIPEALKTNANSVLRDERIEFEVKAVDKAVFKFHQAVTVLNEAGRNELVFNETSDEFQSLGDVAIQLFDSKGKSIRKYSRSDLIKQAYGSGLVPDGKIYYLSIPAPEYPVTILTDYEIKFNSLWSYPKYDIQKADQSVINSVFTVKVLSELDLRYKAKNTSITPQISSDSKYKIYTWSAGNLEAIKTEKGIGNGDGLFPKILISPNKVEYDNYPGDISTWKGLGIWYNNLVKKDNTLSPAYSEEIKKLTAGAATSIEKARIIYDYLQKNFRYVSIQLGIGGFKPFSADFVHKNKYGDCKALSNYMQACLNAVDIKAYSAWIRGSSFPNIVDADFPSDPFNHQILCVPSIADTLWLECTSNIADFGVLGSFTENRSALLLTEDGGVLINTPKSKASGNFFSSTSTITLQPEGSGTASVQLHTTGEYKEDMLNYVFDHKKDDQKEFLIESLGFLQPDAFELTYNKSSAQAETNIKLDIEKIPEFTAGSKMFLNPRIYKLWTYALPKAENRTQDFYFANPFIKTDTSIYKLPEGFVLETLPKSKDLKFEFGSFKSTYQYDAANKSIITTARLQLDVIKIPAANFLAAKNFFNDVLTEYTEKIVIKKL